MTESETSPALKQTTPPELRQARFEDYAAIASLAAANQMLVQSEADWRGMWENNPLWPKVRDRWPIGWVLEDSAGAVVGSIVNVPTLYRFGDRDLICANGRAWVCAEPFRGFAVLLMDEYFAQHGADLFVNTTVGPVATETLEQYSKHVPVGDWQSIAFWVTGYQSFAKAAIEKSRLPMAELLQFGAAAGLWLMGHRWVKVLPGKPEGIDVDAPDAFDARFDSFWEELTRHNPRKLLAVRDAEALNWHFAVPLREKRVWVFTASRGGLLRAYCVVKREDRDGAMPRMRIVDYQSIEKETDLLPAFLAAALRRCRSEGIGMLEHLGTGLPKTRTLDDFAPYRRRVKYWPYYYQTHDSALQEQLARPDVWDPSSFDGDASFE
jgi:hypothetical protein